MVFENGVKNIQATAYNGARTVYQFTLLFFGLGRVVLGPGPGRSFNALKKDK